MLPPSLVPWACGASLMVQILKREAVLIQGELVCDGVQNVFHDRPGISILGSQSPSIEIHHVLLGSL